MGKTFKRSICGGIFLLLICMGFVVHDNGGYIDRIEQQLSKFTQEFSPERIYLRTDKSFYSPGETVWFQVYLRDGGTLGPSRQSDIVYVDLINPKGTTSKSLVLVAEKGIASGDVLLDETLPGGIYKMKTYTRWQRNFPFTYLFEKDLQVQAVVLPHLKLKMEFEKKSYGRGDTVTALLNAMTLENTPLAFEELSAIMTIDGKQIQATTARTDHEGNAHIRISLPPELASSDGLVTVVVKYQGQNESITKIIPIVLHSMALSFFPEGGQLVDGIPSKVAFDARNEGNKAADVQGSIFDETGKRITVFESFRRGTGAFAITPDIHHSYFATLNKPEGISAIYPLPKTLETGNTLAVEKIKEGQVQFLIGSRLSEELVLVGQVRGNLCFSKNITTKPGITTIPLTISGFPTGVLQTTLFDGDGIPQAERLSFINRDNLLQIKITTDKEQYAPREKVTVHIVTKDRRGNPAPASLSLSVSDDKLISFADDQSANILSALLLEPDLKEKIEEPNFYFDMNDKNSEQALDYLLMTRGWRGFAWKEILDDSVPSIHFPPEHAVIAGHVLDGGTNHPITDAAVRLRETNDGIRTDNTGTFLFKHPDISSPVTLVISSDGYYDYSRRLQEFTTDLRCFMREKIVNMTRTGITYSQGTGGTHTGKIDGTIIDQKTGEPIVSANVLAVGTTRGAVTDINGFFTIIGIPKGIYTLRASQVGYRQYEYMNLRVGRDSTTHVSIHLNQGNVEVQGITLGAAANLQQGNRVATASAVTIPSIKNVDDIVKLQNGVVTPGSPLFLRAGVQHELQQVVGQVDNGQRIPVDVVIAADQGDFKMRHIAVHGNKLLNAGGPQAIVDGIPEEKPQLRYYRARLFPLPIYKPEDSPDFRTDFRSTIFWKGDLSTDWHGETTVEFYNSDEVTSFRVIAEGIGTNGLTGRSEKTYYTQRPLALSAKVPVEVTMGDSIDMPITISNHTPSTLDGNLIIDKPGTRAIECSRTIPLVLDPSSSITEYIPIHISEKPGKDTISISFISGGIHDAMTTIISVREKGFPQFFSGAGSDRDKEYSFAVTRPIPGTTRLQCSFYPTVTSNLIGGLDALFQEPGGCFEQTSSKNYPNVIALQYMREMNIVDTLLSARVRELLDHGYQRLRTFETKENGYEWFGAIPPHEALTAYGLLEFSDMEPVYASVDKVMVERTAKWLLSRRDGTGGFLRDRKAVDSFGHASGDVTNAYIVYALAEAGYTDIGNELRNVINNATTKNDPYQIALAVNALVALHQTDRSKELLQSLLQLQKPEGDWEGTSGSITNSGGISLKIETTSLAILALLRAGNPAPAALNNGIQFLLSSRSGSGSFGSTQGTTLALKALTEYARYSKQTTEDGAIEVLLDGNRITNSSYEKGQSDPIVLAGLERYLPADGNVHTLRLRTSEGKHPLPHSISITWNSNLPKTSDSAKVILHTSLSEQKVIMGNTVRLSAEIINRTGGNLPMTIAILGIPGGLTPQPSQLKDLQERGVIDFYETNGQTLLFYYRQMNPYETRSINIDLKADIPGRYEAPASSAYLYYTNEWKSWDAAGVIDIIRP